MAEPHENRRVQEIVGDDITDEEVDGLLGTSAALSRSIAGFPFADLRAVEPPLRSLAGPATQAAGPATQAAGQLTQAPGQASQAAVNQATGRGQAAGPAPEAVSAGTQSTGHGPENGPASEQGR